MSTKHESPAVAIARAHAEAWSNHQWDKAQAMLAPNVHVTAITTLPDIPATDLTGIDDYMVGLHQFADDVVPGTLKIISSVGDDRNSLLLLTVRVIFGPAQVTFGASRHALIDENNQIIAEQVIFFILAD